MKAASRDSKLPGNFRSLEIPCTENSGNSTFLWPLDEGISDLGRRVVVFIQTQINGFLVTSSLTTLEIRTLPNKEQALSLCVLCDIQGVLSMTN